jgi:hypothetical protein
MRVEEYAMALNIDIPWITLLLLAVPLISVLVPFISCVYDTIGIIMGAPASSDEPAPAFGGGAHSQPGGQGAGGQGRDDAPQVLERDYYRTLQVDRATELPAIVSAFRRLALENHPDRNRAPDATLRMQELNEAYSVLRDPARRAEYDRRN